METQRYLQLYITESAEHLAKIDEEIAALVENPSDSATLDELYRHAHSLKGMSATMGFQPVVEVSHRIEDLLARVKKRPADMTPALLDRIGRAFEGVSELVDMIERGEELPADVRPWIAGLEEQGTSVDAPAEAGGAPSGAGSADSRTPASATAAASTRTPESSPLRSDGDGRRYRVEMRFCAETQMPAARAAVAIRRIESRAAVLEADPPTDSLFRGEFSGKLALTVVTSESPGRLREALGDLSDLEHVEIHRLGEDRPDRDGTGETHAGREEESAASRSDDHHETAAIAAAEAALMGSHRAEDDSAIPAGVSSGARRPPVAPTASRTIRVSADRLDRFLEGVGEMIVQGGRLERSLRGLAVSAVSDNVERIRRTSDRLKREVLEMRLLPFETIAHRFVRSVRELSTSLGREAMLRIEGREVRLDRAVLDELVDPINHIVRNAVGHGIEEPEERTALGKPARGTILIALSRKGDGVTIRVSDDGRGMNPELIRRRALQSRIIDEEQAGSLGDDDLFMMTTVPGFSTDEQVSDLSGRGIGMDIVRTKVENLGGRISIRSVPGRGTSINLWLPLTVVIIKAFLVAAAGRTWAVPVSSVRRVAGIDQAGAPGKDGRRLLDFDGEQVPLYSLTDLLSGRAGKNDRGLDTGRAGAPMALVARGEGKTFAFEVESVLSQQEVFVRPLGAPLEELLEYTGATVLEDGQLALILDLPNLVRATRERNG